MMKLKQFYFTGCVFLTSTVLLSQTTLAQSETLILDLQVLDAIWLCDDLFCALKYATP
jgi:hypothetical protein